MKLWRARLACVMLVVLAACGGGGGDAGTSLFATGPTTPTNPTNPGTTNATASDLVVVLDKASVANTGTDTVAVTVTALDANRNALANAPVTVRVDQDAIITRSGDTTGEQGTITGTVSIGSNRTVRTITVTAASGGIAKTQSFQVTQASGGGGSAVAADLDILISKATIDTSGTDSTTATITALDANRNAVSNIPVSVTVDSGLATVSGSTTDDAGIVRAIITAGSNRTARTVTVTARSGTVTKTATFQVAQDSSTVQAAAITLELSASQVNNTGSEVVTATVTAVDANRNALGGVPVRFSIDSEGVIAPAGLTTNNLGVITAQARIGSNRANRAISITATTAGLPAISKTFSVVGAKLTATLVPAIAVSGSTGNKIQYRLVDNNANPMPDQPVTVTPSFGPGVNGVTGVNGDFEFIYAAPAAPGAYTFTATAAGSTRDDVVQVGSASVPEAVGPIRSASVSVTPSVVSVNPAGSSNNQVAVRALFVGDNNKPIPNVRVKFDLAGDANNLGGTFNVGDNTVYSNADGVATAAFIAGSRPGPTNGLTVRACYSLNDTVTCGNFATTTMTVTSEAISVSIGTDELIQEGTGTYIKDYVVMVVDAAGVAKSDIVITPSVDLTAYYKGSWEIDGTRWTRRRANFLGVGQAGGLLTLDAQQGYQLNGAGNGWVQVGAPPTDFGVAFADGTLRQPSCPNEDINRNGVKDGLAGLAGEDLSGNGALEPRKADVSVRTVNGNRTGANGTVIVRLEYPRSYATWVDFVITVQAAGISGTEGRAQYVGSLFGRGNLPALASVFTNRDVEPAFRFSPYGVSNTCQDAK